MCSCGRSVDSMWLKEICPEGGRTQGASCPRPLLLWNFVSFLWRTLPSCWEYRGDRGNKAVTITINNRPAEYGPPSPEWTWTLGATETNPSRRDIRAAVSLSPGLIASQCEEGEREYMFGPWKSRLVLFCLAVHCAAPVFTELFLPLLSTESPRTFCWLTPDSSWSLTWAGLRSLVTSHVVPGMLRKSSSDPQQSTFSPTLLSYYSQIYLVTRMQHRGLRSLGGGGSVLVTSWSIGLPTPPPSVDLAHLTIRIREKEDNCWSVPVLRYWRLRACACSFFSFSVPLVSIFASIPISTKWGGKILPPRAGKLPPTRFGTENDPDNIS